MRRWEQGKHELELDKYSGIRGAEWSYKRAVDGFVGVLPEGIPCLQYEGVAYQLRMLFRMSLEIGKLLGDALFSVPHGRPSSGYGSTGAEGLSPASRDYILLIATSHPSCVILEETSLPITDQGLGQSCWILRLRPWCQIDFEALVRSCLIHQTPSLFCQGQLSKCSIYQEPLEGLE